MSEDPFEIDEVRRLFPDAPDYVDVYDRAGGLGPKTVLAHAVHLSEREEARLVETGTRIAHCPASNLFLGAGVMPLAHRLEAGLTVGLGSDVSGGPDASIFSVMRAGAYAQMARRSLAGDEADALGPLAWLRLGTLDGARALGLDADIGSLEAGKEADLIAIDPAFVAPLPGVEDIDPVGLDEPAHLPGAPGHGPGGVGPRAPAGRTGSPRMTDSVDLLITGGTIVDGTGAPGRPGSVAVVDGRIRVLAPDDAAPDHVGPTRSTRPARSSRRASSTCTATAGWRSSRTAATSPRSGRA